MKKLLLVALASFVCGIAPNAASAETTEVKAGEAKPVDAKTVDPKTVDAKTVDPKTVDPKTVDAKSVDTKTVDTKASDVKSDGTQSAPIVKSKMLFEEEPLATELPDPIALQKALEKKLPELDAQIAADPKNDNLLVARGECYARLNKHEKAVEDYTAAIAINPNFQQTYEMRGASLAKP